MNMRKATARSKGIRNLLTRFVKPVKGLPISASDPSRSPAPVTDDTPETNINSVERK